MRKILRSGQKNHMQVLVSRGQISKQMRGSLIGQRERTQKCINRRLLQPPTEQREIPQRKRDIPRTLRNPRSTTLEHHHHHSQSSPAIIQLCTSNSSVTLHPTLSSSTPPSSILRHFDVRKGYRRHFKLCSLLRTLLNYPNPCSASRHQYCTSIRVIIYTHYDSEPVNH